MRSWDVWVIFKGLEGVCRRTGGREGDFRKKVFTMKNKKKKVNRLKKFAEMGGRGVVVIIDFCFEWGSEKIVQEGGGKGAVLPPYPPGPPPMSRTVSMRKYKRVRDLSFFCLVFHSSYHHPPLCSSGASVAPCCWKRFRHWTCSCSSCSSSASHMPQHLQQRYISLKERGAWTTLSKPCHNAEKISQNIILKRRSHVAKQKYAK